MFFVYLMRELRRRARQAVFIALGLAVGVGLVISVTAASTGVRAAQRKVLTSLYGVGTDITVTTSPTAQQGGPLGFRVNSGKGDAQRPKAGTTFTRDDLRSAQLGTLSDSSVTDIRGITGVSNAVGVLTLSDTRVSGKIPNASSFGSGGFGGPPSAGSGSGATGGFRSNFKISSFTVTGVPVQGASLGTLSNATLSTGRTFTASDATSAVAMLTTDYAKAHNLKAGSTMTVAGKTFTVIGTVSVPRGSSSTNVYIPLAEAQKLSGMNGKVNTVYVAAAKSTDVATVAHQIKTDLPKASVTTSSSLANQVSGSLSSASSLANNLGRWLSVAVLAAAFLLASLLTLSAVSRRVREFGTLKALGWRSRRVVAQVVGEALVIGIVGAVVGIGLGFAGAGIISAVAPTLSATTPGATASSGTPSGFAAPTGGGFGGAPGGFAGRPGAASGSAGSASHTVAVALSSSVTWTAIGLAVVLAIAGGLLAGAIGGWRAARLRPAAALTRVA